MGLNPAGRPRRAVTGGAAAFAPVAVLASLPVVAALWRQGHCLDQGWGGQEAFWRFCYSDLAVSTETAGAGRGITAYLAGDVPLDQPPLTGELVSLIAGLVPGDDVLATQRWMIGVWAVLGMLALTLMAWWVRDTDGGADTDTGTDTGLVTQRRSAPVQAVLAPVAALTLLLSPDLLGVVLATGGLWAWLRRDPLLAGLLLGAGFMARTYPVLLLVVIGLHAWRVGREREILRLAAGALGAAAIVALPLLLTSPATLTRSWSAWNDSAAGLGSLAYIPTLAGAPWSPSVLTLVAVLGVVAALLLAGVLVLGAPATPRLPAVALVVVAIVLVTGKSFPVQASLWLVPLVAMAGLRWRDHLVWALAEAVHFVMVWLYLGGLSDANRSIPPAWYALALLARVGGVVFLAVRAWQVSTAQEGSPEAGSDGFGGAERAGDSSPPVAGSPWAPAI